jgi:hypothetical protein
MIPFGSVHGSTRATDAQPPPPSFFGGAGGESQGLIVSLSLKQS